MCLRYNKTNINLEKYRIDTEYKKKVLLYFYGIIDTIKMSTNMLIKPSFIKSIIREYFGAEFYEDEVEEIYNTYLFLHKKEEEEEKRKKINLIIKAINMELQEGYNIFDIIDCLKIDFSIPNSLLREATKIILEKPYLKDIKQKIMKV